MFFSNPTPIDLHLAKRLKIIRNESGVTQDGLGSLIGVTCQQIHKYESGVNKLSASRLYEICRVLNKPISSFFEGINIEEGYYNFAFIDEGIVEKQDKPKVVQIRNLVKFFSKIADEETRIKIIDLVQSIAQKKVIKRVHR